MNATAPTQPTESGPQRDALASLRISRDAPSPRRGRRWFRRLALLVVLLLLVGGGYWYAAGGWNPDDLQSAGVTWMPEIMQSRVEVRLTPVVVQRGRSADAVVVATGYLQSHRQARIGAQSPGRIDVINFEEGDRVSEGEVLAELDHKDLDASLAASAAQVARAKAALGEQEILIEQTKLAKQRIEKLLPKNAISEDEYDSARFAHDSAVARLASLKAELELSEAQQRQAQQMLENMLIRAPFDGTVISKDAEEGESILPGGTGGNSGRGSVATIADLDHLEIECDVQEGYISRVRPRQQVDIAVDAVPDKKYHGIVRKIIPMGDRARATIKVRVEITDADELLFPEMSGTVYFLPQQQPQQPSDERRMFVPAAAIDRDQQGNEFVWVVDDQQRAERKSIKTSGSRDGRTEVVDGLSGRERVVANPESLSPGTPVKVIE